MKRECPELIEPLYQPHAFVGWRKALEQAGVSYSEIRVELADTVECLLCGKASGAEVMSERCRARLFGVFCRSHTLRPSRSLVPHWEPLWSPEYALDRLLYLHEQEHPIHWQHLYTVEKGLGDYLLRVFHSYDNALAALGLDPMKVRHAAPRMAWDRQRVLEAFQQRLSAGKSLTYSIVEEEFPGLASAAPKYFGTYRAAIEAMGIDYEGEVKIARWRNTPALRREILTEVRRLAALPEYDWNEVETFRKKYRPAIQPFFRSWHGLAAEAGIPVERIMHNRYQLLDRATVLESLRQRHQAGLSVRSIDLARDDCKLSFSVLKHFGKLSDALREAGISDLPRSRPSRYEDDQAILDANMRRKAEQKPLDGTSLLQGELRDHAMFLKARQFFGSWKEAIIAAGMEPSVEYKKFSPLERYPTPEGGRRKEKVCGRLPCGAHEFTVEIWGCLLPPSDFFGLGTRRFRLRASTPIGNLRGAGRNTPRQNWSWKPSGGDTRKVRASIGPFFAAFLPNKGAINRCSLAPKSFSVHGKTPLLPRSVRDEAGLFQGSFPTDKRASLEPHFCQQNAECPVRLLCDYPVTLVPGILILCQRGPVCSRQIGVQMNGFPAANFFDLLQQNPVELKVVSCHAMRIGSQGSGNNEKRPQIWTTFLL